MRDWMIVVWFVSIEISAGVVGAEVLPGIIDKYEAVFPGLGIPVIIAYFISILGVAVLYSERVNTDD